MLGQRLHHGGDRGHRFACEFEIDARNLQREERHVSGGDVLKQHQGEAFRRRGSAQKTFQQPRQAVSDYAALERAAVLVFVFVPVRIIRIEQVEQRARALDVLAIDRGKGDLVLTRQLDGRRNQVIALAPQAPQVLRSLANFLVALSQFVADFGEQLELRQHVLAAQQARHLAVHRY